VSLKSICSVMFVGSELLAVLKDFLTVTTPVSDLSHDMCAPSFDI
jgi:hypothetical protein